jgi:hypothetical protein
MKSESDKNDLSTMLEEYPKLAADIKKLLRKYKGSLGFLALLAIGYYLLFGIKDIETEDKEE